MNMTAPHETHSRSNAYFTLLIVVGVWLVVSPFVVGYATGAAFWNPILTGAAVIALAWCRARRPQTPSLWVLNLLPGAWLLVAPVLLGYLDRGAHWNSIVTGIVAIVLAAGTRGAIPGATAR